MRNKLKSQSLIWALCLCPFLLHAQNYVDVFSVGYGASQSNTFEGASESTSLNTLDVDLTYPVVINEQHALITGLTFNYSHLALFPNAAPVDLYSTLLKLGLASTWNERWSTTLVLLPKLASDYTTLSKSDLYIGGIALLKYKKSERLIYRYGAYGSSEAFGPFVTPIVGWYYLSPSNRFEMDVSLPIAVNINYRFGKLTAGVDYLGIGRSFRLQSSNDTSTYVDVSALEFASYLQLNLLDNSVLIRGKLGYSSSNFEVYDRSEKITIGISAFSLGDDRTRLNPELNGSIFGRIEAIYRFQLPAKSTQQ